MDANGALLSFAAFRSADVSMYGKILLFQAHQAIAGVPVSDSSPTGFSMYEYLESPPFTDVLGKNLSDNVQNLSHFQD
jgi:hypothetical protein